MSELPANLRNRYRALWEFATGVASPATGPSDLQIALNNTCNFKCVYCSDHRVGNDVPRTQLEGRTWDDLLRVIPTAEFLAFHGISEFFVDKRFFELVQRCADSGASLSLNTNGSVATEKHVDVLRRYPGRIVINFSLDAATAPTFLRIRGWDFDRVVRNIRTYMAAFAGRRDRTWTTVSFVILRSNVREMVPFVELAKSLGVDAVKFYRLHEYGSLEWKIEAPDGTPFDYREECTDRFEELHDEHVRAATKAAAAAGLHLEIPALYAGAAAPSGS